MKTEPKSALGPLSRKGTRIYCSDGNQITEGHGAEDYAAEIVKRWNAYSELMEGLRELFDDITGHAKLNNEGWEGTEPYDKARALLARLEK